MKPVTWPSARVGWYAVGVLFVAYIFSFADRYILSLLIQPIKQDLAISDTRVSLLHGLAFAIFYTLMGIPIGRLADRYSRRMIIAGGVAVWSIMTALCGLARNFGQLFAARIGVGVGEAALSPAAYSMIADLFPPSKLGRAMAIYSTGAMVGGGLAFIIGGLIVQAILDAPDLTLPLVGTVRAWQVSFLVVGLPGLLIAALMFTVREPVRLTTRIDADGDSPALGTVARFFLASWRVYIPHFLGFTMLAVVFNAVLAWMPTFMLRAFEMPVGQAGPALGILLLIMGSAGMIAGGTLADRLLDRGHADATLRVGMIAGLGAMPFAIAAPLMPSATLALLFCGPLFFFATSGFGAAVAALSQVTPNRMRGVISALYLFTGNLIGLGLGPTFVALCTDYLYLSDAAVGKSIATVAGICSLSATIILATGTRAFRRRVAEISEPHG